MAKEALRKADHWEVKLAVFVGGQEIVFAEDESDLESPYMVGNCGYENPFGMAVYSSCIGTADYLEAITEYANRLQAQTELVHQERAVRGIGDESLTRDACLPGGLGEDITGKLVIIRPDIMHPDRRTADYQYFLADGGNGCRASAIGSAVFGQNLYDGKRSRWERCDILGVADPLKLPDWANERLKVLQTNEKTTPPKKKSGPER
ncbi:hypothetical protein SDC9_54450 [bioreactor metagenome]|uniref:Uncharacterized protein n=1 Tax=bioreactor metagenome TaxID=1076179 RepID=A0A644WXC4_9ZZZZ